MIVTTFMEARHTYLTGTIRRSCLLVLVVVQLLEAGRSRRKKTFYLLHYYLFFFVFVFFFIYLFGLSNREKVVHNFYSILVLGANFRHGPSSMVNHIQEITDRHEESLAVTFVRVRRERTQFLCILQMSQNCKKK